MAITYRQASTSKELEQILQLQLLNLPVNLSEDIKISEGFVTVRHTLEILRQMNDVCPHIIAKDGEKVVGYALCMHPKFANEIEILKPMFNEIKSIIEADLRYIAMGQICIAKDYRGKGIFRGLYSAMSNFIRPVFDSITTTVDAKNIRSLKAHYAIGFAELKSYHSDGHHWKLIELSIQ